MNAVILIGLLVVLVLLIFDGMVQGRKITQLEKFAEDTTNLVNISTKNISGLIEVNANMSKDFQRMFARIIYLDVYVGQVAPDIGLQILQKWNVPEDNPCYIQLKRIVDQIPPEKRSPKSFEEMMKDSEKALNGDQI